MSKKRRFRLRDKNADRGDVIARRKKRAKNLIPMLPNAVTMLGLAFGVTAIDMAYWGHWEKAMLFIVLAGVFDFLDGKVARLLKSCSKFGMQLDSLADFISFSVAPGFLMYRWTMTEGADGAPTVGIHWGIVLFLAMCCAMRLARFNVMSEEGMPDIWKKFFMGVPAPGGAGLATLPLILWLAADQQCVFLKSPVVVGLFMIASGILMASSVPTVAFKYLRIPRKAASILRLVVLGLIAGLFWSPWSVLGFVGIAYIISIPISVVCFLRIKRAAPVASPAPGTPVSDVSGAPNEPAAEVNSDSIPSEPTECAPPKE